MKLKLLLVFTSFLIISCGCNDDGFESFELNVFERTVIPFETQTTKEFIDNSSQLINSTISEKTIEDINLNASDDESCFTSLVERNQSSYQFDNSEKIYYVTVEKRKFNYTEFYIYSDEQEYYTIQDLETENLELELTDIIIDGFEFSEIFHLTSNNQDTEFETIIYSAQNGIEYLKYRNGNYLKLNE